MLRLNCAPLICLENYAILANLSKKKFVGSTTATDWLGVYFPYKNLKNGLNSSQPFRLIIVRK